VHKLLIALICLLTLYAPLELSRLIVIYPDYSILSPYTAELCLLWLMWGAAVLIMSRTLNNKKGGELDA